MAERRRLPSLEPSKNSPLPSSPPSKKSKLSETDEDIGLEAEEEADISLETNEILSRSSSSEKDNSKENLEVDDPTPGPSKDKKDSQDVENSTKFLGRQIMGRKTDGSLVGEHAHYQELSQIGDGAYGTVYKAKDLSSGQVVALKKVRVPLTEDGLPTSTLREIAGLKQLERFEHPNIVRLLDVCQGNYLQLPTDAKQTESMNRGMILCHRIIHRDLKPQNLLVTRDGRIKIADFGLAKTYDFEMRLTSVVVTLWYRAPEVLLGCPYATPVDIWSVGCILAELNRLAPLFPGSSEGDELDRIFQVIGTPSQEEWPKNVSLSWTAFPQRRPMPLKNIIPQIDSDGLDLITNLLTFNPHVRLTAAQALQHRYFVDSS